MIHYYTTHSRVVKLDEDTGKVIWEHDGAEIEQLKTDHAALVKAARELHQAVDVTMIAMTAEGINIERYVKLCIGDLKDTHENLSALLPPEQA